MDLQNLFDALPGSGAIIDHEGTILKTNIKWDNEDKHYHWFGIKPETENYFTHCERAVENGNDYALKIVFGLRQVLDGQKAFFEMTAPCPKNPKYCWYRVSVSPIGDGKGALIIFEDVSKNMLSVKTLRESEERYSQHFKNSMSGIFLATPEGRILDANPAASRILGYTKDEFLRGGRDLVADTEHPLNKRAAKIREEKSVFEGEKVYIHKDGRKLIVEISSVLYRNEDAELTVINTFRDKTSEKTALSDLNEERRFIKAAMNSLPGLFFLLDSDMKLVRWNNTFTDSLGYSESELLGQNALNIISEEDRNRVESVIREVFNQGAGHTVAAVHSKKGEERYFHFYGNRFDNGGVNFMVGTGTDITDLVNVEKEKDKNYELLSQLFESSPLGMVMISPELKALKVNDSFCELFGYHKLDIIGEKVDNLILSEDTVEEAKTINKDVFSGKVMKKEVIRHKKDGSPLNLMINTIPIWDNDEVVGAYAIYVDLTKQKKMEARIQQSLHEKEILLQEVHHRVKNNLAVIAGLLDLQIMEEEGQIIENKLNEVRSRIFSIAKIHETLYANEDMVQIRFDEYLSNLTNGLPQNSISSSGDIQVSLKAEAITLNLNQAVPCGLAVNELMNSIFSGTDYKGKLEINLSAVDEEITLMITSDDLDLHEIDPNTDSDSFHKKLVEIFLAQIEGDLSVQNGSSKSVVLRFKKMDLRGSSSSIRDNNELLSHN
ncbi:MAG: PAS domain S-box protein [Balneolaceae bacterium]|nr:PAS domain S-box protein [Balneolaceae bacterium]